MSVFNQGTSAGQIRLSGANVTFGGATIGPLLDGVGTTLAITFNAAATSAAIDALSQNLTYANVSNAPSDSLTLMVDVTDAAGGRLNAAAASFAPLTGAANPFNGVDVGSNSCPDFVDLDGDLEAMARAFNGTLLTVENSAPRGVAITVTVTREADTITSGTGNDGLAGAGDAGVLRGLAGLYTLSGDAGADRFVFAGTFGLDTITGYAAANGRGDRHHDDDRDRRLRRSGRQPPDVERRRCHDHRRSEHHHADRNPVGPVDSARHLL